MIRLESVSKSDVFEIGLEFFAIFDSFIKLGSLNIELSGPLDCFPLNNSGLYYSTITNTNEHLYIRSNIKTFSIIHSEITPNIIGVSSFGNGVIDFNGQLTEIKSLLLVHLSKRGSSIKNEVLKILDIQELKILTSCDSSDGGAILSFCSLREFKSLKLQ